MPIADIFNDKLSKPKSKIEQLSKLLLSGEITSKELAHYAFSQKDPVKASCIEALEFASKTDPSLIDEPTLSFVIEMLSEKAPRIKWESAKVIGNCIHLHPSTIKKVIRPLLDNSEHTGTVVRWSAAYAIAQILILKTKFNDELVPATHAIIEREEKNSIKKIYLDALKKVK